MTKKMLYEEVCDEMVVVKMTKSQLAKVEIYKKDFGCSSRSDTVRFIIDNFTVSLPKEPSKPVSPPEKKSEKPILPPPDFSKATIPPPPPGKITYRGLINQGYSKEEAAAAVLNGK